MKIDLALNKPKWLICHETKRNQWKISRAQSQKWERRYKSQIRKVSERLRRKLAIKASIDEMKENGFKLTKKRSRSYPAQTITDADYADVIALLANTPAQAENQLHSLEGAAAGIGLHVNARKTECMCFNKRGDISTLNDSSLKLVDKEAVSHPPRQISTRD